MNREILKHITILSFIVGIVLGLLASVPYISGIALFCFMLLTAPVVMLLIIMAGKSDLTTPKDAILSGSASGFFANITFSFTYAIITAVLYITIKYTSNYFLTAMVINTPIWLFITIIIFLGVLSATTNAFSGFMTYYIINLIRDMYEQKHNNEEK